MPEVISSILQAEVGREYRVVAGPDGQPALERLEGRGRPRGLTGDQVVAARALRAIGKSLYEIACILDTSIGSVRTATGAPR